MRKIAVTAFLCSLTCTMLGADIPAPLLKLIKTQAADIGLTLDPATISLTDGAGALTVKASASYTGINWCTIGNKSDTKAKIHLASLVVIPGRNYTICGQQPMPTSEVSQARDLVLIFPSKDRQGRYSLALSDYAEKNIHPIIDQEIVTSYPGANLQFFQMAVGEQTVDWNSQVTFKTPTTVPYGEILLPSGLNVQITGRAIHTDVPGDVYDGWRVSLLDQWSIQ